MIFTVDSNSDDDSHFHERSIDDNAHYEIRE